MSADKSTIKVRIKSLKPHAMNKSMVDRAKTLDLHFLKLAEKISSHKGVMK